MAAYTVFGDYIRAERDNAKLGLRAAARLLDISPSYLSRLEAGEFPPPSGVVLLRMSRLYSTDIKKLMDKAKKRQHEVMEADHGVAPAVQAFYRLAHDQPPEMQERMLQAAMDALDMPAEQKDALIRQLRAVLANLPTGDLPRRARGEDGLFALDIRPRYLSRAWLASFASQVLHHVFGLEVPLPVPLDTVVSKYDRDIVLIGRDDIEGGRLRDGSPAVLGLSRWARDGSRRELVIHTELLDAEDDTGRRRANFTIAHELFHCLEHLPRVPARQMEGVLARRTAYVSISQSSTGPQWFERKRAQRRLLTHEDWREWQANQFAAELLMPEQAVREAVHELFGIDRLTSTDSNTRRFADAVARVEALDDFGQCVSLANRFDVNPQAMAIRLESLDLIAPPS